MDRIKNTEEVRRKFVEAWNKVMIDIWQEKIRYFHVIDTRALLRSPCHLPVKHDGRFFSFELSQTFLEYGLWQDFGTGRNTAIGNTHKRDMDGFENKRERRPWFSLKYYSSVMKIRDLMARSLGDEFKAMFCDTFDENRAKRNTEHYRKLGLS